MTRLKLQPILPVLLAILLGNAVRCLATAADIDKIEDGKAACVSSGTTIDPRLQKIVEEELEMAAAEVHPQKIIAIFADPNTGKILAMASRHERSTEHGHAYEQASNDAISFCFGPGSTFKMVACAGFLKEGLGDEDTKIFCENGSFACKGKTIKDHKPYGDLTPLEILVKSSNIGSAKMGLNLGTEKFCATVSTFGFGRKTGIELPGESEGTLIPADRVDELVLSRMALGQVVGVTPIQVLMAYAAIANGGILYPPTLVSDPKALKPTGIRILPENVAAFIAEALVLSAPDLAQVDGISVAGKTGTAQALAQDGSYAKDRYVTSFAGYFPAENPKFVGVVVVDRASVDERINYGGLIAAPIFSNIVNQAARYLNLASKEPEQPHVAASNAGDRTVADIEGVNSKQNFSWATLAVARGVQH